MGCKHANTSENADSFLICNECGELLNMLSYDDDFTNVNDMGKYIHRGAKGKPNYYDSYNIPYQIASQASDLYSQVQSNESKTRKRRGLLAACLYRAYKDIGEIKTPNDIAKMFGVKSNVISKCLLEIERVHPTPILSRKAYALKFIETLLDNLREKEYKYIPKTENVLEVLTKSYEKANFVGIKPQSITAGAICYCIERQYKIKRSVLADKLGITEALITAPIKIITEICDH